MTLGGRTLLAGFTPWPEADAERYRAAGYWRDETLGGLLRASATEWPTRLALVDGDVRLTYAELDGRADTAAAGLTSLGIGPGDRVLVQLPNTADFVVLTFGLARCGAVPVMALPAHRRLEIEHLAQLSGAAAYAVADVVAGFDHRDLAGEVADAVPSLRHVLVAGEPGPHTALADVLAGASGDVPATADGPVGPGDVALLLVSGGTTGKPKLIPRTHTDYVYNARASAEVCGLGPEDVYLTCLPAAHNFPLACPGILGVLGTGGTVTMAPVPSPDVAFGLVERERVTVTALVPPLARLWCDAAAWDDRDLSSLRLVQVGGAKLDAHLARRLGPEMGCTLQQVFGMAEGLLNFTRADDPDEVVATTQGRPLSPADEVRIVDEHGRPCAPGSIGELWTRGPYTLRGYYRAPEANAAAFDADGFFRTGDLVRALPSGHLVVEGRVKDVINRGGENVSAGELEETLAGHPDVAQVAVVGVPDEMLGELVCAVVTPAPAAARPPKLKELKAFLTDQGLARFKMPDRLVVTDEMPLTAVGKIAKRELVSHVTGNPTERTPR